MFLFGPGGGGWRLARVGSGAQAGRVTSQNDSLESPFPGHQHTDPEERSVSPAPAMNASLLCCVAFCLLQAGKPRAGSLSWVEISRSQP